MKPFIRVKAPFYFWLFVALAVVLLSLVFPPAPEKVNLYTSEQMGRMTDQRRAKYRKIEKCVIFYKNVLECRK